MIDPTFRNINWLFVSFKVGRNDSTICCFSRYHIPLIEIKHFSVSIDNKPVFDQPVKMKQEAFEKLVKMSINDDYKTDNLLDFLYHQNY